MLSFQCQHIQQFASLLNFLFPIQFLPMIKASPYYHVYVYVNAIAALSCQQLQFCNNFESGLPQQLFLNAGLGLPMHRYCANNQTSIPCQPTNLFIQTHGQALPPSFAPNPTKKNKGRKRFQFVVNVNYFSPDLKEISSLRFSGGFSGNLFSLCFPSGQFNVLNRKRHVGRIIPPREE